MAAIQSNGSVFTIVPHLSNGDARATVPDVGSIGSRFALPIARQGRPSSSLGDAQRVEALDQLGWHRPRVGIDALVELREPVE
jgi:hypothetical protein